MFVVKLDKKVYGCENMPDLNSSLYAYRCLQCFSALHHARAYRLLSILTSYGKVLYFLYSRIINSGIIDRFLRNPFKRRLQIYLEKTRTFFFLCSCRKEHGVSMPQATAIMTPAGKRCHEMLANLRWATRFYKRKEKIKNPVD